ncbi:MAG: hypothetical protein WKG06_08830 [Segetibacter sp.]
MVCDVSRTNIKLKRQKYWLLGRQSRWEIRFTTMDDTAAYTAEVALDDNAPRDFQIASFKISPNIILADV